MHPFGRQAIGINQPPSGGTDFPFVAPSPDIEFLLGDFYLTYEDDICQFALPFSLTWLFGFGTNPVAQPSAVPTPTHTRDLVVKDALGQVVFDSTTATDYAETSWGDRLLIIEWKSADRVCRCTMHTEWSPEHVPQTYDTHIQPQNGILDGRTHERLPLRLRSLRVGLQKLKGPIRLVRGFNVNLVPAELERIDGTRRVSQIGFDMTPGGGLGRAPGCQETAPVLRQVNQIQPDASGNFIIELDDCLRAQLALTVDGQGSARTAQYAKSGLTTAQAKAALALYDDCKPCCDCDHFLRTYKGLKRVWDRWQAVATQLEGSRDTYSKNRDRWLTQRQCRIDHALRLIASTEPDCKSMLGASWCNVSEGCVTPVEIRFTFERFISGTPVFQPPSHLKVVEASISGSSTKGDEKYTPIIKWPVIQFIIGYANPQAVSIAKLRLCYQCANTHSLKTTVTVHTPNPMTIPGKVPVLPIIGAPLNLLTLWSSAGVPETPTIRALLTKTIPLNPNPAQHPCNCL